VDRAGGAGVYVQYAGNDGVQVDSAGDCGVDMYKAGGDGVYAHTDQANHEWGFYTPDKI
jgi:hypothetical protein